MQKFLEVHYKKIVILILTFVAIVSIFNARNDSAIFDETAHIPAGYSYLEYADFRLNPEHPPLIKNLAAIPLVFMNLGFDTTADFWTTDINGQWDAGRNILWQEGNDADRIIFWSRFPIILIALLLGWFVFRWTKELAGTLAGIFALILYSFDPNILGHNHFVTTDIGIAAFGVFSFYYFLRFIKDPSWKNMFIGGIFLGLLQLAKFSSITLFPIYGLVILIYPFVKKCRPGMTNDWKFKIKTLGKYLGKGILAFGVSVILIWGVYLVNIYKMPQEKLDQTIEYYFPTDDPSAAAKMVNKTSVALNKSIITRPLSGYLLGMAMVFKRVDGGNGAYFMEKVSSSAFRAYFPTVFVLKEPLVMLFFMLVALAISFSKSIRSITYKIIRKKHPENCIFFDFVRHNITSISLFSFVILYSYISITSNLNIGFRHLFPILPFIYILTAKTIFDFLKKQKEHTKKMFLGGIIGFSVLLIATTISAYPYYMSYFNELAGGPKNGYHYVTDSNADWGQDLKRLKNFVDRYNWCPDNSLDSFCKIYDIQKGQMDKIHLNYFGGADIKYYFGEQVIDWWDSRRPIEEGWYALSTNYLMGSIYDTTKPDKESYRWVKNIKPFYQVGTSIFIYYITPEIAQMIN